MIRGGTLGGWILAGLGLVAPAFALGCTGDASLEQPAPLYGQVPIEYPLELWDGDVEGETLVRVLVNETGGVDSVEVLESSGHPAFDSAAVEGAEKLRFRPARKGDQRIPVWAQVPVQFKKRPNPARTR